MLNLQTFVNVLKKKTNTPCDKCKRGEFAVKQIILMYYILYVYLFKTRATDCLILFPVNLLLCQMVLFVSGCQVLSYSWLLYVIHSRFL